jgi:hypothetical protein
MPSYKRAFITCLTLFGVVLAGLHLFCHDLAASSGLLGRIRLASRCPRTSGSTLKTSFFARPIPLRTERTINEPTTCLRSDPPAVVGRDAHEGVATIPRALQPLL